MKLHEITKVIQTLNLNENKINSPLREKLEINLQQKLIAETQQ